MLSYKLDSTWDKGFDFLMPPSQFITFKKFIFYVQIELQLEEIQSYTNLQALVNTLTL
jgi:hypothetical protein